MLQKLHINNFAIIDDLVIPFGPGLNIITGETGAGKSIIIEALDFVTGDRAMSDVIRSGADEASVTAVFENGLTVKRSVSNSGKSKVLIDGKPVSVMELKKMRSNLLEISSQHEHQRLLNEDTHLELVDKFGGITGLKEGYGIAFENYTKIKNRLAELMSLAASATEQKEFLSYQVREIDEAGLKPGIDAELEREKNVAKYGAKLLEKVRSSYDMLYSSESPVIGAITTVNELLKEAGEIDSSIKAWLSLSDQASVAVEELSRNLENYLEKLDVDPARLEDIETRLYEIGRLKKKHAASIEGILEKRGDLARKLDLIENSDYEIGRMQDDLKAARVSFEQTAKKLSVARKKVAEKLTALVQKELDTLGLKRTTFMPGHTVLNLDVADERGIDRFGFLISPNAGEPLKPLARIASGGELSRVMLAIKGVLMKKLDSSALEVFDEVDVGIGGAIAEMIGAKLKEMSERKQIICITHLPQVASFGDHHIAISKKVVGSRTVAGFKLLDDGMRVDEIARMLGGSKITKATKEHAREMLTRGGSG